MTDHTTTMTDINELDDDTRDSIADQYREAYDPYEVADTHDVSPMWVARVLHDRDMLPDQFDSPGEWLYAVRADPGDDVDRSARAHTGATVSAKLKRGTDTRDQDELTIKGKGETADEAADNFDDALDAAEKRDWAGRLRRLQADDGDDDPTEVPSGPGGGGGE